jgi:phosphatidylglycerophosphate synthase
MPDLQDKLYRKIGYVRDQLFRPLVAQLTLLKITPDNLTAMGVGMMLLYLLSVDFSQSVAVIFLVSSVMIDSLDGVLARYQHISSDRGKFLDVMADNFNSFLFSLGLAHAHLVHPLTIIAYVYFMLLGKAFKIYINSSKYKSDWLFRAVAGFSTNLVNYLAYSLFIAATWVPFNLNPAFLIMTIALIFYCGWHFTRIINKQISTKSIVE